MLEIGKKIRELRKERELTLDMLVDDINSRYPELNFNKSMLSRWENGLAEPSLNSAKYISMYFNVSLDYLIGLTDVKTPSRLLAKRMGAYIQAVSAIGERGAKNDN